MEAIEIDSYTCPRVYQKSKEDLCTTSVLRFAAITYCGFCHATDYCTWSLGTSSSLLRILDDPVWHTL